MENFPSSPPSCGTLEVTVFFFSPEYDSRSSILASERLNLQPQADYYPSDVLFIVMLPKWKSNFFVLMSSNLSIWKNSNLRRSKELLRKKRKQCQNRRSHRAADDRLFGDEDDTSCQAQGCGTGCSQPSQRARSPACATVPGEERLQEPAGWSTSLTHFY